MPPIQTQFPATFLTRSSSQGPVASFSFTDNLDGTVTFTDTSTGSPTSWLWDFGDSSGTSIEQNPTYDYGEAGGVFTVTLTATNAAGSGDTSEEVDNVAPLLVGLVSHWSLEEASGTRSDDFGGNTLTDNNTVTQATGKVGNAAQFTAANNEYLSRVDNAALSMGDTDATWAGWIYLDSLGVVRAIMSKYSGTTNGEFLLYVTGSNVVELLLTNNTTFVQMTSTVVLSASTWYYVVARHDSVANTVTVQINNGTVESKAWAGGMADTALPFNIGANNNAARFFDGRIDEADICKRVRTPTEITWLYNSGNGRTWAEIVAYRG